jgi:4-amino-4-deoxy-L-arabinose transferase-like glycosyltransferase
MVSDSLASSRSRPVERGVTLALGAYWHRSALFAILVLAAVLNFWGLSREGYANGYYAAAVKSMLQNWHNFFFNSFDPGGFVTIDKPPLGFWLQVASAKIFGFNGMALLLPQALAGVLSVGLIYYLVNRIFGRTAGLISALALAVTPISVVTNRDNTIDSTLVFVLLLGAWAITRAIETGKLRWLLLCALFVGLGFNIKMLQAYLVLPAFGLVYLVGARIGWRRRIGYLLLAAVALLAVSLSWVTVVDLTPASQRPWVGSTTDNSELSLAIGYNGLQRLTGNSGVGGRTGATRPTSAAGGSGSDAAAPGGNAGAGTNAGGPGGGAGGPGGVGENGPIGPLRLLDTELGSQIGWLLPLAVIGFLVGTRQTRRRWPLDRKQSALVLWGMWLLTTGVFFSIAGFYHTYYLVMVAPAIAALSGIGITMLWQLYRRPGGKAWWLLPVSVLGVAAIQAHVLADYPAESHWLTPLVVGVSALAALILTGARVRPHIGVRAVLPAAVLAVFALLAAPAVWAADSTSSSNGGAILHAGPTVTGTRGGFGGQLGGFGPPVGTGNRNGFAPPAGSFTPPTGAGSSTPPSGRFGPPPGAGSSGPSGGFAGAPGGGGPGGSSQVNRGLLQYLEKHRGTATFLVAVSSAMSAESYILATGDPVMALGGFTGGDPILTPSKLAVLVKQGTVRYFLLDGRGGFGGPGAGGNSSVTAWVQSNCTSVPASKYSSSGSTTTGFDGGQSLYDCGAVK